MGHQFGTKSNDDKVRYLAFLLGDDKFSVPLLQVKEVIGYQKTTPVPNTPTYYLGIINIRGDVIPIIDLRLKLKTKNIKELNRSAIIVIDFSTHSLGLVVDSIENVLSLSKDEINEPPSDEGTIKADFIEGIVTNNNTMNFLIDVEKLFSSSQYKKIAA